MSPGSNTESYSAFAHTELRGNPGKTQSGCRYFKSKVWTGSVRRESYCVTTDTIVPVQQVANLLRNRGWEVHEEIHSVSEDDSHRRVDIIAINRRTQKAMVLDPTICFERDTNQALEINDDKRAKYLPCLPYLSEKYGISLYNWDATGLLFGARGFSKTDKSSIWFVSINNCDNSRLLDVRDLTIPDVLKQYYKQSLLQRRDVANIVVRVFDLAGAVSLAFSIVVPL
ncbi:hypothetical protein ANN_19977 [Periplaneta americana]|uniref:Uncharacterized protein n=1 Tax=Periplaneta americana TaxID=6978 RepID=A0ABQ8SBK3_PERAM|nr:hypothetical protein ANN_19977 [Periplaneta americana]